MTKIGVFDSGIGGVRFAHELQQAQPHYKIQVVHDRAHMPYGDKTPAQIAQYTAQAIQPLIDCDVIVLACNTATAYAIDYLRELYPQKQFVGFEPAIKVATAYTKTRTIAVLATPATLRSERYKQLRADYKDIEIIEPHVGSLAHQIETKNVDWPKLEVLLQTLVKNNVDTIVLGCTHYHLIKNTIAHFAGSSVRIVTPTAAVITQIEHVL